MYAPQREGEQRHVDSTGIAKILKSIPNETVLPEKKTKIHTSLRIGYVEPEA